MFKMIYVELLELADSALNDWSWVGDDRNVLAKAIEMQ